VEQLEGFAAPAAAWESEILPARLAGYEPEWLDDRCLAGRVTWRRLASRNGSPPLTLPPERGGGWEGARAPAPVRSTPIALLARRNAQFWTGRATAEEIPLSPRAEMVAEAIRAHGASFFDEMIGATGLLPSQLEEALAELVALGLVNSDSFG